MTRKSNFSTHESVSTFSLVAGFLDCGQKSPEQAYYSPPSVGPGWFCALQANTESSTSFYLVVYWVVCLFLLSALSSFKLTTILSNNSLGGLCQGAEIDIHTGMAYLGTQSEMLSLCSPSPLTVRIFKCSARTYICSAHRRMGRLVWADRNATVTQRTTLYNLSEQKSISECTIHRTFRQIGYCHISFFSCLPRTRICGNNGISFTTTEQLKI